MTDRKTGATFPTVIAASVAATGTNLTYAWYSGTSGNTSVSLGVTQPSMTVSPQTTTSYWVRVTSCSTTAIFS